MVENKSGVKRVGILTGGGDCPGLNAVIRSVAKPLMSYIGVTIVGIEDGFEGMVQGRMRELTYRDVSGIIGLGGTIIGTSNKGDPFHFPVENDGKIVVEDCSQQAIQHYYDWKLDALVAIGGDGTMHIAEKLSRSGLNIVGVPKTIDNDLMGTDITFGHDSAIAIATDAVDRLQTTASAHKRVMVLEVMGRYAGWIALASAIAGAADVVLIPEIPFTLESVNRYCLKRSTRAKFTILVVAEGAKEQGGELVVAEKDVKRTDPIRLGGIGNYISKRIQEATGLETRATILGHVQRGGTPTHFDRLLATKYGTMAAKSVADGAFNTMVSLRGRDIVSVPLNEVIGKQRLVSYDDQMVYAAKSVGMTLGDE
jgi:6-phosphofructokinase 1